MARKRRRLVADTLHQAAVAGDHEDVMVDHLGAQCCAQMFFGDGHAHGVRKSLTERPRCHLNSGGVTDFRVARGGRAQLSECPQIVEFQSVPVQPEKRVLQDRRMSRRQDEAVAVRPTWVGRVVAHDARVERVGERRQGHRRSLVTALRVERSVHGHPTDDRNGPRIEVKIGCVGALRGHVRTLTVRPGEKGQRQDAPRVAIHPTVRKDLSIVIEFEFGFDESVRELSRIDPERTDVARNLFIVFTGTFPEDHLEDALTRFVCPAIDERHQMRRKHEGRF